MRALPAAPIDEENKSAGDDHAPCRDDNRRCVEGPIDRTIAARRRRVCRRIRNPASECSTFAVRFTKSRSRSPSAGRKG